MLFWVLVLLGVSALALVRARHLQERETAAVKKAKLAETKEKLREEDARLVEQEKALQVTASVRALLSVGILPSWTEKSRMPCLRTQAVLSESDEARGARERRLERVVGMSHKHCSLQQSRGKACLGPRVWADRCLPRAA